MSQFVRVLTHGKGLEAINENIVSAAHAGSRVLVKTGTAAGEDGPRSDGGGGAVADWAAALSQEHGLVWHRVGQDILFTRPTPE